MRKGVIIPSLVATFALGWAYKGGFIDGIVAGAQAIYYANIMAARELFGIISGRPRPFRWWPPF
ncbi:MAG TPA: hypothetical protein VD969_01500 [Symbiobacteriaceae bacterium]|nr:hypothetical protein [Symbiobacteriaceae bacterium]